MRKCILFVFIISFSLVTSVFGYFDNFLNASKNSFYAEIFGGANFVPSFIESGVKSTYKTGYDISGSLGYQLCNFRLEAEYAFRKNSLKNIEFFGRTFNQGGHYISSAYMANLLFDIPLNSFFPCFGINPFFGAGIGYDTQKIHGESDALDYQISQKGFAWQVIAGLMVPIFCNSDISLEYKFHKGHFKNLYNHTVGIGLIYYFGN